MRADLDEFLVVLAYSAKTQWAILLGVVFFVVAMLAGDYFVSRFEIHGILAPLTEVIRDQIAHRYDKVAWAGLVSFLFYAFKCFRKDRKRLLGI